MNSWIKMQKTIMFIPGANIMPFVYNDIYYRKICNNRALQMKVSYAALVGILLIDIPMSFALAAVFSKFAFWEELKGILYPYIVPLTMDYFMLRCQCKNLNVTPEEIGPRFYKFLLLKKRPSASPPPTDNTSDSSCDNKKE